MGAEYFEYTFPGTLTRNELKKEFVSLVADLRYEYGHGGYTGTFAECSGLTIDSNVFDTISQAREYVDSHARKWGDAIAVKCKDESGKEVWYLGAICSC